MQKESQTYKIAPADRLASVSEYYFSKKLKEVAQMNAEGKDVISLGIGSPDMPPSKETIPKGRGLGKEMKFAGTAKGSHFGGAGKADRL